MATKRRIINPFDIENSFAGGGSFFTPGRYRFEAAYYTLFDFNGKAKAGDEAPALCIELQPLDDNGKDNGDAKPQFWPIRGEGVEMVDPIKGKRGTFSNLEMTGKFDQLLKGGEYFIFMEHLRKSDAVDMDQFEGEITVLDGLDCMMDLVVDPYEGSKAKDKDDKDKKDYGPRKVPVVIGPAGKAAKGGSKSDKSEKGSDKKESKGSSKKEKEAELDADELLLKYIEDELSTDKEQTTKPLVRMGIGRWITGEMKLEADKAREVQELVNDDAKLGAALKAFGWKLKGKEILPPE